MRSSVPLGLCSSGYSIDLNRPRYPALIVGMDGSGTLGIYLGKLIVQALRVACKQLLAHGGIRRRIRMLRRRYETVEIQPRSAADNGQCSARSDILYYLRRFIGISAAAVILARCDDIYHMVRNTAHLSLRRLCRSDIHSAVYLHRIAGYHLASEQLRKSDRKCALAGRRRTGYA